MFTVLESGNVGIGTTSPLGKLHIYTGSSGQSSINSTADELVLEGSGDAGLTIMTPNTSTGRLRFVDSDSTTVADIRYSHTDNSFTFRAGGSDRMVLSSNGDLQADGTLSIDGTGNNYIQGNVGIGTTSPAAIQGGRVLSLENTNGSEIVLSRDDTAVSPGNLVGSLVFMSNDNFARQISGIKGVADQANGRHRLEFYAGNVEFLANTPHMVIDENSNVGIGTTVPSEKLQILDGNLLLAANTESYLADNGQSIYFGQTAGGSNRFDEARIFGATNAGGGGYLAFYTAATSGSLNSTERLRITNTGNIGIGTTTPSAKLTISGAGTGARLLLEDTSNRDWYINPSGGNLFFGDLTNGDVLRVNPNAGGITVTGGGAFSSALSVTQTSSGVTGTFSGGGDGTKLVLTDGTGSGNDYYLVSSGSSAAPGSIPAGSFGIYDNTQSLVRMVISTIGNIGIGTTTPTTKLTVAGVITPDTDNTYSLGNSSYRWSELFSANGTINTSDERLKDNVTNLTYGLTELMALTPVSFTWKDNPEQGTKLGLIAQDVDSILPEVVHTGSDAEQTLGIRYTEIIPVIIKSIQDIGQYFKDGVLTIMSAEIEYVQSDQIQANTAELVEELCIGDTCVNEADLKAFLEQSGRDPGTVTTTDESDPEGSVEGSVTESGGAGEQSEPANDSTSSTEETVTDDSNVTNDPAETTSGEISDDILESSSSTDDGADEVAEVTVTTDETTTDPDLEISTPDPDTTTATST